MKTCALLIVIASFSGQASIVRADNTQAQWQAIAVPQSEQVHFYVDTSSVHQSGKFSRARVLYDFKEPQLNENLGIYSRSYIVDSYIDCKQQRLAPEKMTLYSENMGLGTPQGQTAVEKVCKWATARPGTTNGAIADAVCRQLARK